MNARAPHRPTHVNPPGLAPPRGYSHGVLAQGVFLAIAGQVGWDASARLVSDTFIGQLGQALANVVEVLRAAGGAPSDLVRVTLYVTDKREYLADTAAIGEHWRRHFGRMYPAMTLVEVKDLLEPGAKVEVEATAVLPPHRHPGGRIW